MVSGYWTTEGAILGLSKVQPNADVYLPIKLRNILKVEPGDHIAWVLENGNIVIRKGRWQPGEVKKPCGRNFTESYLETC